MICRDRKNIPAVPPELDTYRVHSFAYSTNDGSHQRAIAFTFIRRSFLYGEIEAPARVTGKTLQLALRSPFETLVRTAIPPPAILCAAFERFYLPFIIGLLYYITGTPICQVFFEKKSDFVGRAQSILNFTQFCVQYHG